MLAAASMDVFADLRVSRLQNPLPEGNFDFVVSALTVHDLDSAHASLATIKEAHSRDCVRLRAVPPLANAIGNLRRADPKDATTNERLIRSTLECSRWPGERAHQVIADPGGSARSKPRGSWQTRVEAAKKILSACLRGTVRSRKDHSISLIATYHTSDGLGQELGVCPAGDTYSGIAGVGLLAAALSACGQGKRYQRVAEVVAETLLRALDRARGSEPQRSGAFSGPTAVFYAIYKIADLLEEPNFILGAASLLPRQYRADPETTGLWDVISGNAGRCLSLMAPLKQHDGADKLLETLIFESVEGIKDGAGPNREIAIWPSFGVSHEASGFAHGAAGMAAALARAHALGFGDQSPLAQHALALEWEFYDSRVQDWRTSTESSSPPHATGICGWCHGGAGILLAISELIVAGLHVEDVWVERAINATLASRPVTDGLCHGLAGVAGISLLAAQVTHNTRLARFGARSLDDIAKRFLSGGGLLIEPVSNLSHSPGLMCGGSGIGLALLGPELGEKALGLLRVS